MMIAAGEDIQVMLRQTAEEVNEALRAELTRYAGPSERLAEAMRYSLEAEGKRLRPALVLWCCEVCGGNKAAAMPAAVAVECVHTFSLIHDDLPALDDDDMRRGRPSCHREFDEAAAILAGDALLALAFEILVADEQDPAVPAMVRELARATGWHGMIGGELADIEGESAAADADLVARIHAAKTARLIEAACRLGALASSADNESVTALAAYGRSLGLAFQATDDLLDATVGGAAVGKRTGKDKAAGKQTYVHVVGIEEARRLAILAADRATAALVPFGSRASRLASLARFVVERKS